MSSHLLSIYVCSMYTYIHFPASRYSRAYSLYTYVICVFVGLGTISTTTTIITVAATTSTIAICHRRAMISWLSSAFEINRTCVCVRRCRVCRMYRTPLHTPFNMHEAPHINAIHCRWCTTTAFSTWPCRIIIRESLFIVINADIQKQQQQQFVNTK